MAKISDRDDVTHLGSPLVWLDRMSFWSSPPGLTGWSTTLRWHRLDCPVKPGN